MNGGYTFIIINVKTLSSDKQMDAPFERICVDEEDMRIFHKNIVVKSLIYSLHDSLHDHYMI